MGTTAASPDKGILSDVLSVVGHQRMAVVGMGSWGSLSGLDVGVVVLDDEVGGLPSCFPATAEQPLILKRPYSIATVASGMVTCRAASLVA